MPKKQKYVKDNSSSWLVIGAIGLGLIVLGSQDKETDEEKLARQAKAIADQQQADQLAQIAKEEALGKSNPPVVITPAPKPVKKPFDFGTKPVAQALTGNAREQENTARRQHKALQNWLLDNGKDMTDVQILTVMQELTKLDEILNAAIIARTIKEGIDGL